MTEPDSSQNATERSARRGWPLWAWLFAILAAYGFVCLLLITLAGLGFIAPDFAQFCAPLVRPFVMVVMAFGPLREAFEVYFRWLISFR